MSSSHDIQPEELSAFLDGALAPTREAQLRAALAELPELAAQLAALSRVDDALRALSAPEVPADLHQRLRARIAAAHHEGAAVGRAPRRCAPDRSRRWRPALMAVAAAAAVLAGLVVLTPSSQQPEVSAPQQMAQEQAPHPAGPQAAREPASLAEIVEGTDPGELSEDWSTIEVLSLLEAMDDPEAAGSG